MATGNDRIRPFLLHGTLHTGTDATDIRSPYSGELVGRASMAGPPDVEAAIAAAIAAAPEAAALPSHARAATLNRIVAALTERQEEFAALLAAEAGKPLALARAEVGRARFVFQQGAEEATRMGGEVIPMDLQPHGEGYQIKQYPRGPHGRLRHRAGPDAAAGGRMTETGLSLGTPHYMSPEQATAEKEITARSDVYSLGSVLYEMLAGQPPHLGGSAQQIIMKIVTDTARPVTELRKSVPPNVAAAVGKSLEKLPADRFESAKAFAEALQNQGFTTQTSTGNSAETRRGSPAAWVTYALGALVILLGAAVALRWPSPPAAGVPKGLVRFSFVIGPDTSAEAASPTIPRFRSTRMAFSPDGRTLVYAASRPNKPSALYEHRIDLDKDIFLLESDTDNYSLPVFSPDGTWLAFVRTDSSAAYLERISMSDHSLERIASAPDTRALTGLSYGDDGTIVAAATGRLYWVPASGGVFELLAEVDSATMPATRWFQPYLLPGSKTLLFHASRSLQSEDADIMALDLATDTPHVVVPNGMNPIYMSGGYLLFMREGTLWGVRFDPDRAEVQGQPVMLLSNVMHSLYGGNTILETGAAQVAVSSAGHLAYAAGGVGKGRVSRIVELTVSGDTTPLALEPREWHRPRISPDGARVLVMSMRGWQQEIWIHDLDRGITEQLKTGGNSNSSFAWSPDGESVVFSSDRDQPGVPGLYRMPADGSTPPERLGGPNVQGQVQVSDWSSENVIVYVSSGDIWVLPPDGQARPFVATSAEERWPAFSPDGHWMVYGSLQSGRAEVVVRPYPGGQTATVVSAGNAFEPSWSRDGRTIFYHQGDSLMAVDVPEGPNFRPGRPRLLGPWRGWTSNPIRGYDILPNGAFLRQLWDATAGQRGPSTTSRIYVILNFLDELKERVKP
ncbi:MAG: aldehyde dehydrogenase family protein [Gemmatimonadales bacterium]